MAAMRAALSPAPKAPAPPAMKPVAAGASGLAFGPLRLRTPVMLAPMAGVTNPPFRRLCREQAEEGLALAGVWHVNGGYGDGFVLGERYNCFNFVHVVP